MFCIKIMNFIIFSIWLNFIFLIKDQANLSYCCEHFNSFKFHKIFNFNFKFPI